MKSLVSVIRINHTTHNALVDKKITQLGPFISILIPAHNEEGSLENVIGRTQRVLKSLGNPYEIIVVDDGSTDQTCDVAYKRDVSIIRNYRNCGKGHALQTGFNYCSGSIIVTIDADGSHQPEELPQLITPLFKDEYDVVIGSRFKGCIEKGALKRTNLIGNMIFNFLIFLLSGKLLTDTQSGFRAFKKSTLSHLNLTSSRYEIESEMTAEMLKRRFRIKEVPIYCKKPQRPSGLRAFKDGHKIVRTILKTFLRRNSRVSGKRES